MAGSTRGQHKLLRLRARASTTLPPLPPCRPHLHCWRHLECAAEAEHPDPRARGGLRGVATPKAGLHCSLPAQHVHAGCAAQLGSPACCRALTSLTPRRSVRPSPAGVRVHCAPLLRILRHRHLSVHEGGGWSGGGGVGVAQDIAGRPQSLASWATLVEPASMGPAASGGGSGAAAAQLGMRSRPRPALFRAAAAPSPLPPPPVEASSSPCMSLLRARPAPPGAEPCCPASVTGRCAAVARGWRLPPSSRWCPPTSLARWRGRTTWRRWPSLPWSLSSTCTSRCALLLPAGRRRACWEEGLLCGGPASASALQLASVEWR